MGDPLEELRSIVDGVRALVDWEEEISGTGWPEAAALGPLPVRAPAPLAPSAPVAAESPVSAPLVSSVGSGEPPSVRLRVLQEAAAACTACRLHAGRTKSVFARGTHETDLAFVGEGPGYHEDQQGLPFVGNAGQLLDKMIQAMGYTRDGVYICNVVKCRPPENRTPKPDEAGACRSFLEGQLGVVQPKVIVALGRCATEGLGCAEPGAKGWRGRWADWNGIPVMPTYHPAFLLRSPEFKKPVWDDLQKVMAKLGRAR